MSDILRTAHGAAAAGGAVLVAELPPNGPEQPKNVTLRPSFARFGLKNTAASARGPSLTRLPVDRAAPPEQRRIRRKAASLKNARARELQATYGTLSTGVHTELVAWATATSWAEYHDRLGDGIKAAALHEKASGHQLKAIGIAEKETEARKANEPELTDEEKRIRLLKRAGLTGLINK